LQGLTNRLAGLPGNKFQTKNLFQQFFKMNTFIKNFTSLLYGGFTLVTPGQSIIWK